MGMDGLQSARHRRWVGLLLLGVLTFWPVHSAQAKGCAGNWITRSPRCKTRGDGSSRRHIRIF
jgi:hypothetical protein